jgi:predicted enzyme related to lactoylglutathione lyase
MKMYPPGVPCWVETLQPDPRAALAFYGALFGWEGSGPGPMPDGGEYFVAHLGADDVAGIATLPAGGIAEPAWATYVRVDGLEVAIDRVLAAGGRVIVGALDVKPAGRLAIIEAPAGGTLGLWEPIERTGAQRINQPGAWAMSALRTRDLAAAVGFYATVFGWNVEPFDAGGASGVLFRLPGYVGGLAQQPVPRDVVAAAIEDREIVADHWSVDFWIADVDAAVECVARNAGTVVVPAFEAPPFRRAVIADPAGAICTISQLMFAAN